MINRLVLIGKNLNTFFSKGLQTFTSTIRVILLSRPVSDLPKPKNKKCSILGNGPSLNASVEQDIDFLRQTDLACLNTFASSDYYTVLQPANYVLIDPAFFSEEGRERDIIIDTFQSMVNKTSWEMNLFVPRINKKSILLQDLLSKRKNITVVYFNYTIFEGFDLIKHFIFSKGIGMPQAQNVMVATLFLMINRKYDQIFLFGADHSWHEQLTLDDDNVSVYRDLHFYDKTELEYKPVSSPRKNISIRFQFESIAKAFAGYEILRKYADSRNVKVFNASKRSYIDAFEKVRVK
jgi:hypothetical protein